MLVVKKNTAWPVTGNRCGNWDRKTGSMVSRHMGPAGAKSKILALWWTKASGDLTGKCMDQGRKIRNLSSVKGHMSRWYTKLVPYIMDINAMAFSVTLALMPVPLAINVVRN
jgi:hypothetical protein